MDIISLIILSSVAFLVLRLGILPIIQRKSTTSNSVKNIKRMAAEAAVSTAASIASLLSFSALIAFGLIKYLQNLNSTTLEEAEKSLEIVRAANESLSNLAGHFGFVVLGFCALATIVWSYRQTKITAQNELNNQISEKMEKLQEKYLADELEELEPSDAMLEIETHIAAHAEALSELEGNGENPENITSIRDELQRLIDIRHSVDLLRRAEAEVISEQKDLSYKTARSKWVTFFTSDGFFNTLGFGGKILAVLGVLSIIPASLAITSPAILTIASEKRNVLEEDIRNLTFVAELNQINKEYESLPVEEEQAEELSDEDEAIIDSLAQSFESELFANGFIATTGGITAQVAGRAIVREGIRKKLLSNSVSRNKSLSLSRAPQAKNLATLLETEKLIEISQKGKPATPIGQRASNNYRELAKKNPKLWANLKKNFKSYQASFGRSASPIRVSGIAINQALGDALSTVGGNKSIFAKQASKFGADISADAAKTYFEASYKKFVIEFNRTGDLVQSARSSGNLAKTAFSPNQVAGLREMVNALPSQQVVAEHVRAQRANLSFSDIRINKAGVENAVKRTGVRSVAGLEALSGFNDYFPGHAGQEFKTNKASVARSLGLRGAPPTLSAATRAQMARSARISARSGSYIRLRGFSRVGGVLIGRKPNNDTPITIDMFDWEIKDGKLWFEIAANDNAPQTLGPYSPSIANLALGYVADGRPTTVTMVNANPIPDLKILIHPSLIDTGLGCRARRLDQFADGANSSSPILEQLRSYETDLAIGEIKLYNLARNIQFIEVARTPSGRDFINREGLSDWLKQAIDDSKLPNEQFYRQAAIRLTEQSIPLTITKKPEYFLTSTAQIVKQCMNSDNLDSFQSCAATKAKALSVDVVNRGYEWSAPIIEYVPWSGVREREYTVDDNFHFMKSSFPKELGPLRFMVQLAISSPAYFADPNKEWFDENNIAAQEYTDSEPWEFPKTAEMLNPVVFKDIKTDDEKGDVYKDMVEFTHLQRFFRAALDGNISETFPLEELNNIQAATSKFVNTNAPTLRWNARRMGLENVLAERLSELPTAGPKIRRCYTHIQALRAAQNATQIKALGAWDKFCSGSALSGEVDKDLKTFAENIASILNLRRELRVDADNSLAEQYQINGCPRP